VKLPDFELELPDSLEAAAAALAEAPGAGLVAGGTDQLCNWKFRIRVPERVVSLARVPELRRREGRILGAGLRLAELERDPEVRERWPALAEALGRVATPLVRESATLGGNLCLDTRCFHLQQTREWREAAGSCLKAEGPACRVLPKPGDRCVATYSGDLAPVLLVLGARLHLARAAAGGGLLRRVVELADFHGGDGIQRFRDLQPGEILEAVEIAEDAEAWTAAYEKLALRRAFDFPEGGVAAAVKWEHGRVRDLRLATTAYDTVPRLHPRPVLQHRGSRLEDERIEAIARDLEAEVQPLRNTFLPPAYRKRMARVLARRALRRLRPAAGAGPV